MSECRKPDCKGSSIQWGYCSYCLDNASKEYSSMKSVLSEQEQSKMNWQEEIREMQKSRNFLGMTDEQKRQIIKHADDYLLSLGVPEERLSEVKESFREFFLTGEVLGVSVEETK